MQQQSTAMHLDKLEQYGRRENREIHGVPTMRNESTNQIVKTVAKALNVQLGERHISTSHRLTQHQNQKETRQYPPGKFPAESSNIRSKVRLIYTCF